MQHPMTQLAQDVRTGQDRQYIPWASIIPIVTALAGGLFGKKNAGQKSPQELGQLRAEDFQQLLQIPQIQDFLRLQQAQVLRNEPLNRATSQMAFQLLPKHARQGITYNPVPTPNLSFGGGGGGSGEPEWWQKYINAQGGQGG